MTRELKLALIVGFSLVLIVTVLVSDHLSKARRSSLASPRQDMPLAMMQAEPPPVILSGFDTPADPEPPAAPGPQEIGGAVREVISDNTTVIDQGQRPQPDEGDRLLVPVPGQRPALAGGNGPQIEDPLMKPAQAERVHVVADGETLFQIARKHYGAGNSWTRIAQHNGIRAEQLKPGMKLRLHGLDAQVAQSTPKVKSKYDLYTVKPGDTLAGISKRMLGSPSRLSDLIRLNGIEDGDTLNIGQTIRIPNS